MSAARDVIARALPLLAMEDAHDDADCILAALSAAGYRIVGPDQDVLPPGMRMYTIDPAGREALRKEGGE